MVDTHPAAAIEGVIGGEVGDTRLTRYLRKVPGTDLGHIDALFGFSRQRDNGEKAVRVIFHEMK